MNEYLRLTPALQITFMATFMISISYYAIAKLIFFFCFYIVFTATDLKLVHLADII